MSGIDEQNRDVTPCGCERYKYWAMFDSSVRTVGHLLGYLNPDSWLNKGYRESVNRVDNARISKDDFISKIRLFHCEWCAREVKFGDEMFGKLCSDVRTRWDIKRVRDR